MDVCNQYWSWAPSARYSASLTSHVAQSRWCFCSLWVQTEPGDCGTIQTPLFPPSVLLSSSFPPLPFCSILTSPGGPWCNHILIIGLSKWCSSSSKKRSGGLMLSMYPTSVPVIVSPELKGRNNIHDTSTKPGHKQITTNNTSHEIICMKSLTDRETESEISRGTLHNLNTFGYQTTRRR